MHCGSHRASGWFGRRGAALATATAALLMATGAGVIYTSPAARASTNCTISANLVSSCRPWFGAATSGNPGTPANPLTTAQKKNQEYQFTYLEGLVGHPLDVYRAYDSCGLSSGAVSCNEGTLPFTAGSNEQYFGQQSGMYVDMNWTPDTLWAGAGGNNPTINAEITQVAQNIAALPGKVFLTLAQEPQHSVSAFDNSAEQSACTSNADYTGLVGTSGTPAQYVAMWQNVENIFNQVGATNVIWTMDYAGLPSGQWDCLVQPLWPGNNLVDWVGFDAYSQTSLKTWDQSIGRMYNVLASQSTPATNFDSKPWGALEFGDCDSSKASQIQQYFANADSDFTADTYPNLKMYLAYASTGNSAPEGCLSDYDANDAYDAVKQTEFNQFANDVLNSTTPPDATPPSAPGGLTATVASPTEIDLSWQPSTDNVGVGGYDVYRNGTQIANVISGTSYADTTATAGTAYQYTVAAYDTGGNASGQSTAASAQISPALSLADTDSLNGAGYTTAGQAVTFTVTAANTGNVALAGVTVSDPDLGTVSCPQSFTGSLSPGAAVSCTGTYNVAQADLDSGSYTNHASATSTQTPAAVTASDTINASQSPALTLDDSDNLNGAAYTATGQQVTFTVTAANTGNVALAGVTVSDPGLGTVSCPSSFTGTLSPGATVACTGSYTIGQADLDNGSYTNHASATSTQTTAAVTATDTVNAGQNSALSLTDTDNLNGTSYNAAGQQVTFTATATNTGNVSLRNVTVSDADLSGFSCPAGPLGPGAAETCTGTYSVTQADLDNGSYTNQASVTSAQTPAAVTATATVQASQDPALSLADANSLGGAGYTTAGQQVTFTATATNTGNVSLANVTVSDPDLATVSCPASFTGTLAPGASVACTGTYTITQADLDNDFYTNQAGVTSTQAPAAVTATNSIFASQSPALSLADADSLHGGQYATVGQQVTFTATATNVGDVTLHGVNVSDSGLTGFGCPASFKGTLAVGAKVACTGSYSVTQADLDNGSITDQPSATTNQTPTAITASDTVSASQSAAVSVTDTDSLNGAGYTAAGQQVTFSVTAANSGNVTLADVTVGDSDLAGLSCPASYTGTLIPGAAVTCTGSYTVTQADLDNGLYTNQATASSPRTSTATAADTINASQNPALTLTDADGGSGYSTAGQPVTFTLTAANTGNVTLSNVTVSDSGLSSVTCPASFAGALAPGASVSCTGSYSVTQADLDGGSYTNHASVTSSQTSAAVTASDTIQASQNPALSLADSDSLNGAGYTAAGQPVTFTVTATNAGNVTLTDVTVSDADTGTVTCPASFTGTLAVGASVSCTGSYAVTQADLDGGSYTNQASATSSQTTAAVTASDTVSASQNPALSLANSDSLNVADYTAAGQPVTFTVTATNTGNVTLANVAVKDSALSGFSCPAAQLSPGAAETCTGSYSVTQANMDGGSYTNKATATSTQAPAVTASDTIWATQSPNLTLSDADNLNGAGYTAVGQHVTFTLTAGNTGNVTLTNVTVSDPGLPSVTCPGSFTGTLAPGASVACTGMYTITQADLDNGSYTNQASATSTQTSSQSPIPVTATDTISAGQSPGLSLADSDNLGGAGYTTAGQQVTFTVTASNTGNLTLANVAVSDPGLSGFACPGSFSGALAPGASVACTGTYTVTQADLDAGSYTNQASATSIQTPAAVTATDTISASQKPGLSLADADNLGGAGYTAAGQQVTFTVTASNSGNVTLQGVAVSDSGLPGFACPGSFSGTLAPGASVACTGSYTITQADLDNGSYTNHASATSTQTPTAVTATDTIQASQKPALSLADADSLNGAHYTTVGQQVTFSVTAANTGNVTLSNVAVSDPGLSGFSCPAAPLSPGASETCTGSHTITQANLDAGSYTNTASATSTQTPAAVTATDTIQGSQKPALSLTDGDSLKGAGYTTAGQKVTFTVTASNTGNVTLAGVAVSDGDLSGFGCPGSFSGTLAPGATVACTGTYTITQANLDAGSYTNHTSATSTQTPTAVTATDTINASQKPALKLADTDSLGGAGYTTAGQQVTFTVTASNTGNVTLQNVTVSDSALTGFSCPASFSGALAPGASVACTGSYTITQANLDSGSYVNHASATSTQTSTATASDTINASQKPTLSLADADSLNGAGYTTVGQQVTFTVTASNSGNVTLHTVKVTDSGLTGFSCPASFSGSLAPGATVACTGSYTVTQANLDGGSYTNTASATSAQTSATVTAGDTIKANQKPVLSLTNVDSLNGAQYTTVGQQVTFTVTATNSGNVTLHTVKVTDSGLTGFSCSSTQLSPGATVKCTGTYTITQANLDNGSYTNTASGTSIQTPTAVTASDTIKGSQQPALTLAASSPTTGYQQAGNVIAFNYLVTNSGNLTLKGIGITDAKAPKASCPTAQLSPGASETCTRSYTVTAADVTAGQVTDTSTATGTTLGGTTLTTSSASVTVLGVWPSSVTGTYQPAAGAAEGFYLSSSGNTWTLNVTHPGTSKVNFTGTITVNAGTFTNLTDPSIGTGNTATVNGKTLTFSISNTGQVNGFQFTGALPVTSITFTLKVNGTAATAGQIYLGGSASPSGAASPVTFTR